MGLTWPSLVHHNSMLRYISNGAQPNCNCKPAVGDACCRPWTTFLPLAIVLGVAMIKEAIEDYKRYRQDVAVNNCKVQVTGYVDRAANLELSTMQQAGRSGLFEMSCGGIGWWHVLCLCLCHRSTTLGCCRGPATSRTMSACVLTAAAQLD
jgi:hypothetical protein